MSTVDSKLGSCHCTNANVINGQLAVKSVLVNSSFSYDTVFLSSITEQKQSSEK